MIGEAGYETSEESSDFKDVREMRADKTQTWLSAGFGDDSPHEFVGTIMPASRAAEGKCAALHRFANAGGTLYSALYEDGQEILSCERSGEGKMISDYLSRIHVLKRGGKAGEGRCA